MFPPQLDRSKKYPLIVNPHGGPNTMSSDAFSVRWNYHLLTAPGYVLIATNYTGSTGFGEAFANDIERDVLRGPAQEILEAAEEAMRRYPFIDRTRQAAIGASYGGYLMNWFNGHTDQFRALVIHAGASNNESQYGVNDGGLGRELRMGAPIWETGKGQWQDQSPVPLLRALEDALAHHPGRDRLPRAAQREHHHVQDPAAAEGPVTTGHVSRRRPLDPEGRKRPPSHAGGDGVAEQVPRPAGHGVRIRHGGDALSAAG